MRAAALAILLLTAAPMALAQPAPSADARRTELNRLLDALPAAPDETAASALEARIRGLWSQGASPAVLLLLRRGARNMESEAPADAVEDFDAALTLQPDHAESWLLRAQAQAATGDMQAALRDLRQVLVLEPRHFGALAVLSAFQEQLGDNEGALRSMQEAVTIHPRMSGAAERLKRLNTKVTGEDA
ncbi:tetratricopeptide repeat protein [Roseomonas sp. 18066]|uniref:tetratricopeptide repeat protein n=1 Tax=Roseomonas sp. 18066 TaxID=2681412 RepID=UPI001358CAD9|nr:tetratricopeptide repeat protein [Roseomonas sp. 18066]